MAKDVFEDKRAFRQSVRMAKMQIAGLGDEELKAALAYELEPFSHIAPDNALVAYRELDAEETARVFDVAIVERKGKRRGEGRAAGKLLWFFTAAGMALFLAMIADWRIMEGRKANLGREIAIRRPLDREIKSLETAARNARSEAQAVSAQRERESAAQQAVARMRSAFAGLMREVSAVAAGRCVVKSFTSPNAFEVSMTAVAFGASEAADLMADMAKKCAAAGWHLQPGAIEQQGKGSSVSFTCTFVFDNGNQA